MSFKLDHDVKQKLLKLLGRGVSSEEAARRAGVSRATAYRYAARAGKPVEKRSDATETGETGDATDTATTKKTIASLVAVAANALEQRVERGDIASKDLVALVGVGVDRLKMLGAFDARADDDGTWHVVVKCGGHRVSNEDELNNPDPDNPSKED